MARCAIAGEDLCPAASLGGVCDCIGAFVLRHRLCARRPTFCPRIACQGQRATFGQCYPLAWQCLSKIPHLRPGTTRTGQEGNRFETVCIAPHVPCRNAAGNNALAAPLFLTRRPVWIPEATPTKLAGKAQNAIGGLEAVVRGKEL